MAALSTPWPDWQAESEYYYTGANCLKCGKLLNADGGHPAEIYAGTFNGLCYGCTGAGPYIATVSLLDGARVLSYPPHCPSWRRDRETYTAYPGCATCNGTGVQRRCVGQSGYREYCKPCIQRYSNHPVRLLNFGYREKLQASANRVYQRQMTLAAGLKPRDSRKRQEAAWAALDDSVKQPLKNAIMARYNSLMARHEARIERLGGNAWRPPTEAELAA
jgi:hypothetical protein